METKENIGIRRFTEIRKTTGGLYLESVEVKNGKTSERRIVRTSAVLSKIGARLIQTGSRRKSSSTKWGLS